VTEPGFDVHDDSALPSWAAAVPHEARHFQGQRAGFVTRSIAAGIDMAVIALILGLLYAGWAITLFVVRPASFALPSLPFGLGLIAAAVIGWLYFVTAWTTTGRTFGSRVMGTRVVNHHGEIMRVYGAAVRAAFCLAFMPGLLWVIVSNENRSLQDTVLRTSVVHDWTKRPAKRESRHKS
jgi:uncharacterized RDD family membrane protein YckC